MGNCACCGKADVGEINTEKGGKKGKVSKEA